MTLDDIAPSTTEPIVCPRCLGWARIVSQSHDPRQPDVRIKTFSCFGCGKQFVQNQR
jgi:hypothetical protein